MPRPSRPVLRLIVLLACLGPVPASAADERVYPPGSRIGLVPPAEMSLARGISGFRNPKTGAAILAVEMPADAYPGLAASFSDAALKAQGFSLKARDALPIGSGSAILITGDQAEAGRAVPKTVLLASDPTMTALVIGQLPPGSSAADVEAITTALRTVSLRPPLGLDEQMEALPFRLGDRAGFRPVRAMAGNSLLLTDGPNDAVRDASQPMLIVAESMSPPPPAAAREAFARQTLAANTFIKDARIERSQGFRQRGSDWHEIVALATDMNSGAAITVMQTIRFEPDGYIRAVGIVREDQRQAVLPRFRQVVDSVSPR